LGASAGHGPYSLLQPPFLLLRPLVYTQMPINLDSVRSLCLFTLDMMDRECSSLYCRQGREKMDGRRIDWKACQKGRTPSKDFESPAFLCFSLDVIIEGTYNHRLSIHLKRIFRIPLPLCLREKHFLALANITNLLQLVGIGACTRRCSIIVKWGVQRQIR
jgi:hypothetical protein